MPSLFIAHDHLEACLGWQEVINAQQTVEAKDEAGLEAIRKLGGQTFHGTRKLIVGADTAMLLPDGVDSLDELLWPQMQFGETYAQGWLGRTIYTRIKQDGFIDWPLYHPRVLGPADEEVITPQEQGSLEDEPLYRLPIDRPLNRPLHFPVGLINYALCYA